MANHWVRDWSAARKVIRELKEEVARDEERETMPMEGLRRRKHQLETAYNQFSKLCGRLLAKLPLMQRDKVRTDADKVHRWYTQVNEALNQTMHQVVEEEAVAAMPPPMANSTFFPPSFGTNRTDVIRVEAPRPPELLAFDGNPLHWPAFRDRFIAEVHARDHIEPVMKLIYLQKMCVGDAKAILGDWRPLAANYTRAWLTLQEKFEDVYQMQQALVAQMINMPGAQDDTRPALRGLIDTVTNATRQLQASGLETESWDPLVIGMIMNLLPAQVKDVWEQRRNVQHPPTLKDLLAFLEARARGKLYAEAQINHQQMMPGGSQDRGRAHPYRTEGRGVQPNQAERQPCKLCKEAIHPLYQCSKLTGALINDRWQMVQSVQACVACLKMHNGQCGRVCLRCKKPHDRLLCRLHPIPPTKGGPIKQIKQ